MLSNKPLGLEDRELRLLIEEKENARVEFEEALRGNAPERIREAICAFANDLPGSGQPGVAIVGLKDDGSPADIEVTDELLRTLADMRSDGNILPLPTLLSEKRQYGGRELAVVTVWPTDSPPVRCRGVIHVRIGPRRSVASAQDERILNERRRYGDRPFDISPVSGAGVSDLDRRRFEYEYLPQAADPELLTENGRSFDERLAAVKMVASVDDPRPTILGLLVAGVRPKDFIPGAYVQFLRIAGLDWSDEIQDELVIDGTIFDVIGRLDDKIRAHNFRRIDFLGRDREQRTYDYPPGALQQLMRNAVMHRDYGSNNAPSRVTWFDDRIEIQSPGGPYGSVTAENFGQPGLADYRNPNLAEAMRVLGFVQRFGMGIEISRQMMRKAGHPDIEFRVDPTHVIATVRAVRRPGNARRGLFRR